MPYSKFTLAKAKADFGLTLIEGVRFLPEVEAVQPSNRLQGELEDLPWTIAVGSEKARSEAIIYPVLQEVRRILDREVSLFSGREFNVDPERELVGCVDFLLSQSRDQLIIEAPVIMLVEAKKADLNEGLGQCVAEMVAAQQFNQTAQNDIPVIYGCISSGTQWRFLKLEDSNLTIDLTDYALMPVGEILGFLLSMVKPAQKV